MLALSRLEGESVLIGDDVKVTVVWVKGKKVRLGIEAPRDKEVWRQEIALQVRRHRPAPAGGTVAVPDPAIDPRD